MSYACIPRSRSVLHSTGRLDSSTGQRVGLSQDTNVVQARVLQSGGGWERWCENYLANIALEYDPSWLTDLPYPLFNLHYENSAPGYLAFLLTRMLLDGVTWPRMNQFSIIDKEAKWFASAYESYNPAYWDCDAEYVEVKWDQVARPYNVSNDEALDAAGSIHKLDQFLHSARELHLYQKEKVYGPRVPSPWLWSLHHSLKHNIKLLVRWDNRVEAVDMACTAKCYTNGWCICRVEKGGLRERQENYEMRFNGLLGKTQ